MGEENNKKKYKWKKKKRKHYPHTVWNEDDDRDYYTTTFYIPKWLALRLKEEAENNGYNGMSTVVVIACTNHILKEHVETEVDRKLIELHKRESRIGRRNMIVDKLYRMRKINEGEKDALWI